MRVLVIGTNGFVGGAVKRALRQAGHEVHGANRGKATQHNEHFVDLTKPSTISRLLVQLHPDAIINCAGVIDTTQDVTLNGVFTANILAAAVVSGLAFKKVIVSGSAAEYGNVQPGELPVKETTPLRATLGYGLSKKQETTHALEFGRANNLPVVVARIFNPVGAGMNAKFLLPRLIQQCKEIKAGTRAAIEISRLDSPRDYLSIKDTALAIKVLAERDLQHDVYNIGSGTAVTNQALINMVVQAYGLSPAPRIIQTETQAEPPVASVADISRITTELGWRPRHNLQDTIKEIVHAAL